MVVLVPVLQKRAASRILCQERESVVLSRGPILVSLREITYVRLRLRRDLECLAIVYIPQTPQQVGTEGVQLKESQELPVYLRALGIDTACA